jgi:DNA-binding PadR family transcriptional regulator
MFAHKDHYGGWDPSWHRHPMFQGWHGMMQARRGDIGPILLGLLADRPRHGYEIIRELEKKSYGLWRPSPGSVYPTLQMLEEQDLVTSREEAGKKIYTLTEQGQVEAKQSGRKPPWAWPDLDKNYVAKIMETRGAFFELVGLLRHVAQTGSEAKLDQARAVLKETKSKLENIVKEADNDETKKG